MAADVQEVNDMAVAYNNSMYSLDVPELDIDLSECEDCDFDCWNHGFCKYDKTD